MRYALELKKFLSNYKWLVIIGFIIFMPGAIFFIIHPYIIPNCPLTALCSSGATPLGAIASIFLYDSWLNIVAFAVYVLVFYITNLMISSRLKQARAIFAASVILIGAVFANVFDILIAPNVVSYGSSGALYALEGVLLGFILINLVLSPVRFNRKTITHWRKHKKELVHPFANALFGAVILMLILFDTGSFLSAAPGVNVPVHGIAFLFGFIITLIMSFVSKYVFRKNTI